MLRIGIDVYMALHSQRGMGMYVINFLKYLAEIDNENQYILFGDIDDAVLLIVGDGPEQKNYEEFIKTNSLEDKVKLLGFVQKKEKNYLFNYVSVDKESGLTVEPCSVSQLTSAIKMLCENDDLRMTLENNARKRVKEKFDINKIKNEYQKFYNF